MADGVTREWLVLGPVPLPENTKVDEDSLPGETQVTPHADEKVGGQVWKKVTIDTAYLDFVAMFGKRQDVVAYAYSHVYSETGGTFRMNMTYVGGLRVILNGKAAPAVGPRISLTLAKGWNSLLLKASPGETGWYLVPTLHGCPPAAYEETNIAWTAPFPNGTSRIVTMPAPTYKQLIRQSMPLAKERGDTNKYSDVAYKAEDSKVRVTATRFSDLKKHSSPLSLLIAKKDDKWLIVEEMSESRP